MMTTYICPMHPEVKQPQPGMCPECGMRLIAQKIENRDEKLGTQRYTSGYDKSRFASANRGSSISQAKSGHAGHSLKMFARKFWLSLALTIPVVFYSDLPEKLFGFTAPSLEIGNWKLEILISVILGSVVFFYGGWIFLTSATRELRARLPGMMTLIALAITTAYFWSIYAVFSDKETLFWELTTLITVMLLGHLLEMKAVQGAQGALRELSKLLPDVAEVVRGDRTETIELSQLKEGDVVFVRPGGKIPADGAVIDGSSEVNESMITGESKPVPKKNGSEVIAGTINGDGSLKIKITKIGEHTFLAGVMRLVQEAQASKSRLQILGDRAAFYLTIVAVATGIVTFILWLGSEGGFAFAVERLVAVLVIACPHALGLAIPLVASISTTMGARSGLLVRQRLALEAARKIDVVLFDKTGTLTRGEYGVDKIIPSPESNLSDNQVLEIAASVDSHSEHFIAQAIVREAKARGLKISEVKDFRRLPGKGVSGIVDGSQILIGGETIFHEISPDFSHEIKHEAEHLAKQGKTIIFVIVNRKLAGLIALADVIREESRSAIETLKKLGAKVAMITGDSEDVAKWVADELGIDEYFARVLPDQKAEIVKKVQSGNFGNWKLPARRSLGAGGEIGNSSRRLAVAMVGDGINDAPALTQSDLGIAIGAGTNVAIESAGIILVKSDPRDIVKIIQLSRLTYTKMVQNLFWATGYNIVALPLAAGVLASYGVLLQPAVSAIFMSLSTVIVAINAILLRRTKLDPS